MSTVFIGLMSGTSLDGVDGVVVDFADFAARGSPTAAAPALRVLAHDHVAFAAPLRAELLSLNRSSADELNRAALAANMLVRAYAGVVKSLLARAGVEPGGVVAIGCHGQTVRHRPGEVDGTGYTIQLNAPALLAELTGIDVVADFRSRDVAAGGHGAPLAPGFHRVAFAAAGGAAAVLNIGGIANLTSIEGDGATIGFDCGPGNALLDHWHETHRGGRFDASGAWAATGSVDARLLDVMLADPYFALPPPKSTGRDLFNAKWLEGKLAASDARRRSHPEDVQATLAELTARSCAQACAAYAPRASEIVVCGGGALNTDLLARLGRRVAPPPVVTSDARGLPPDHVEAAAFAWLARAHVRREPGNVDTVTGARGPRILGALYPAR